MDNEIEYLERLEFYLDSNDWFNNIEKSKENTCKDKENGILYFADILNNIY